MFKITNLIKKLIMNNKITHNRKSDDIKEFNKDSTPLCRTNISFYGDNRSKGYLLTVRANSTDYKLIMRTNNNK